MVGMVKDASAHPDELQFKDPEEKSAVKPDLGNEGTFASASESALKAAPEAGVITTIPSHEPNSQQDEPSASQLFGYLQQGMETLRGLNLEGFFFAGENEGISHITPIGFAPNRVEFNHVNVSRLDLFS